MESQTMEPGTPTHLGQIVRLNPGGLAYIHDEQNQRYYPFTFDKIRGYRGQYHYELTDFYKKGLREGITVQFTLDDTEDKINMVFAKDVR